MSDEPTDVAGVLIRTEAEALRLIGAQLRGVGPWARSEDYGASEGLERALDAAGPWLPVFARTIAAHLEDADLEVRTLAVVACAHAPTAIGPDFLALALLQNPHLYAGVKPVGHPTNQPDLRWSLLVALGEAVGPDHADGIGLLRAAAREERGYWLEDALARVDGGPG